MAKGDATMKATNVGRTVHYVVPDEMTCRAAIITRQHEGGLADLWVLPWGAHLAITVLVVELERRDQAGGTWHRRKHCEYGRALRERVAEQVRVEQRALEAGLVTENDLNLRPKAR